MADTQIDELRLDVTIEDKTSGESSRKKVGDLAAAISRLNKAVDKFDAAKLSNVFNSITASIKPLSRELKGLGNKLDSIAIIAQKGGIKNITKSLSPILATEEVQSGNDGGNKVSAESGGSKAYNELTQSAKELNVEMKNLSENVEKSNKAHNKLLKSFGRIALYRAIRTVLKQITQAFMDSIQSIAAMNEEFGNTFSELQTSLTKIKASIGVAFYQVLIVLQPLIENIANGIANLASSISKVSANLRGTAGYTKINTDAMNDYKNAVNGALLSFDTFTTLSSGNKNDYENILENADDALDEEKFSDTEIVLKEIFEFVGSIIEPIKNIFSSLMSSIKELLPYIFQVIQTSLPFLTQIIQNILPMVVDILNEILPLAAELIQIILPPLIQLANVILPVIVSTIKALKPLISASIKFMGFMLKNVIMAAILAINAIIAAINLVIDIVNGLLYPLSQLIGLFGGGSLHLDRIEYVSMDVSMFEKGGMFDGAGTMYALAGESGAEVVATGSNGTGVLNVDQFADAMVSALVRYGAARDNGSGTAIEIDGNRLGTLIASSAGFRNEANRRNAGLNWK